MSVLPTDRFAIARGGVEYRTTGADLLDFIAENAATPAIAWGGITGDITDQADLMAEIAAAGGGSDAPDWWTVQPPAVTVYCSPSGNDTSGDGSASLPFRTIQKAYDSLPYLIERQCTIMLAPGTYNTNYLYGSTDKALYPRNAVLVARGRFTGSRTANNAGTAVGPVVIKSNGGTSADTIIETSATLTEGVYATGGSTRIIIDGTVGLRAGANATVLLVAHEGAKVATLDVPFSANGYQVSYLAYAESCGAQIEATFINAVADAGAQGLAVSGWGGTRGFAALVDGLVVISGSADIRNCEQATLVRTGGVLLMQVTTGSGHQTFTDDTNRYAIYADHGAQIELRGQSAGNQLFLGGSATMGKTLFLGAIVNMIYTNLGGVPEWRGAKVRMNTCGFDRQMTLYDSDVYLLNSNSYVVGSATSKSLNTQPVRVVSGPRPYIEGTCSLVGSADGVPNLAPIDLVATTNGQIFDLDANCDIYFLRGDSASRTGCGFSALHGWEGRVITVFGRTSNTVTLENGVGALGINNTTLEIGARNAPGVVREARFVFTGGVWQAHNVLTAALAGTTASYTTALDSKLAGIEAGATANDTDAELRDRATHTGTQAISTITGLQTALDGKQELITVGATAPSSPTVGQLWVDTN